MPLIVYPALAVSSPRLSAPTPYLARW